MTTKRLKELFYQEAKLHFLRENRTFTVDENNKNFLNLLCKYFAQDSIFETQHKGELRKGLFVYGENGTGKSSSFDIMQTIALKHRKKQLWFPKIHVHEIVGKFNTAERKDDVINYYAKGIFTFDDLGSEKIGSNYGKEEIFIRIMELRYNEFLNKGTRTHITSNLNFEDIGKRYGTRVQDRFYQMFNILKLDGVSRRF